jgi:hypothetical protein
MADITRRIADLRRRAKWCRESAEGITDEEIARALLEIAAELEAAAKDMAEQAENPGNANEQNPEKTPC